jgi:hypothetical protein
MKLTKKQQRGAAEKAALKQRLLDLAHGAYGGFDGFEPEAEFCSMAAEMGLEAFGRWIGAIEKYLISPTCFEYFDTIDKAVDHLYRAGVRA